MQPSLREIKNELENGLKESVKLLKQLSNILNSFVLSPDEAKTTQFSNYTRISAVLNYANGNKVKELSKLANYVITFSNELKKHLLGKKY